MRNQKTKTNSSRNKKIWIASVLSAVLFSGVLYYIFSEPTIEDLSGGTLPLTFKTKNPELQKLLIKIAKEKGLPNQIIKNPGIPDKENFAVAFEEFYESEQFQKLLKEYKIWQKEWDEAYARVDCSPSLGLPIPRANKIDFLENSKRFNNALEKNKSFAKNLNKILQMPKCFFQMKISKKQNPGMDPWIVPGKAIIESHIWMVSYINYLYFLSCIIKIKDEEAALALDNIYAFYYKIMDSNIICQILLYNNITMRPYKEFLQNRNFSNSQKKAFLRIIKKWRNKTFPQTKFFTLKRTEAMVNCEYFYKNGLSKPSSSSFWEEINPFNKSFDEIKANISMGWTCFFYDIENDEIEYLQEMEKIISNKNFSFYQRYKPKKYPGYNSLEKLLFFSLLDKMAFKLYEFSLFRARLDTFYILFSEELGIDISEERKTMINPLDGKPYSKDHKELKKLLEFPD